MSGRRSRDKGNRVERAVARLLKAKFIGLYRPDADIGMALFGTDGAVEMKCSTAGLGQLHNWLNKHRLLIAKTICAADAKGTAA
jgi:hypothetical protein